ncbi:Gfo/Idh/MocA family protein [Lignipirellula cremea]|uniref:Inositol 2-dehydrogenase n=1 Tax=Lignipirellula cremea TaxID=2528010 RepID=A0A518DRJ1_9BACT|nr:Gfo/Idh/MocA family oxidoreductase [Lignipirellula cremea]QDU94460.1 Inositol 2-dehydrogenase [Lignipirellula cremea]
MAPQVDRRRFLEAGAAGALGALALTHAKAAEESANETIVVGVMGVNGRGRSLARGFSQQPNCEVAYIADVDERAIAGGQAAVDGFQKRKPEGVADFRKILDDQSVDVLVVAAPNHWHAPATILGCKAGKHVYVEKPCSQTAAEGELAVAAARKHSRVVQMGSQRRSRPSIIEGVERVQNGDIGRCLYARTWYNNRRGAIGVGKEMAPPKWLDYALWQGPAPERVYKDNVIHYNWHWHWHWGNGELGNNGVHALDVARWGMEVDYPTRVTSAGGRYRFEDDQETADTQMVSYEFGDKMITWEGLSWSPFGDQDSMFGICFHGDEGTLLLQDTGYTIFDMRNKVVEKKEPSGGDAEHFANFLDCIRTGERPNADIEIAHKSTLLCHLGNIAQRTGRALTTDPENGHIQDDAAAEKLWSREYNPKWEPTV